jgi:hypothetical protein
VEGNRASCKQQGKDARRASALLCLASDENHEVDERDSDLQAEKSMSPNECRHARKANAMRRSQVSELAEFIPLPDNSSQRLSRLSMSGITVLLPG